MKAMILAAGRGERMRPLTDTTPKPLLDVAGKRLIEYHIQNLQQAGFKDIVINVAWLGQQIIDALGSGEQYGVNIRYSNEGDAALETGGGIYKALPLLGDEPFLVINGDVWTDYPLSKLKTHRLTRKAHLVLVNNPQHNPEGDFYLDGDQLASSGASKYTYSGIGIYCREFFSQQQAGAFPLAPMIREFIQSADISGELYPGDWFDIGTVERLQGLGKKLKAKS